MLLGWVVWEVRVGVGDRAASSLALRTGLVAPNPEKQIVLIKSLQKR